MPYKETNRKACEIAAKLSKEWNTLVAGSINQSEAYMYKETRSSSLKVKYILVIYLKVSAKNNFIYDFLINFSYNFY